MAICAGCAIDSSKTGEYSINDPVEEDGTYENGKFVCTNCYSELIGVLLLNNKRADVGTPSEIQRRIKYYKETK